MQSDATGCPPGFLHLQMDIQSSINNQESENGRLSSLQATARVPSKCEGEDP